ncbi:MAG: hypothetical protein KatS3mg105_4333 [Gemmatales bacterium]|nr:MAG: hypothetical protein KatS3mg105_4333 [Gemmatales bacterium]
MMPRPPCILHCTSQPFRFFGRERELALLDQAAAGGELSLVALIGPGGQGKTAIAQHWLQRLAAADQPFDGVFLWSFYRGKDADLCLRRLFAYAEGCHHSNNVSASYCVDRLIPRLRSERWAIVLDGTEVVQFEAGSWFGRFVHPDLGRFLEELASESMPGVVVLTSRFATPELERRRHARIVNLGRLDTNSARLLLRSLGVIGDDAELDAAADVAGFHAKAVELLGTYLVGFEEKRASRCQLLPPANDSLEDEDEARVSRVLSAFHVRLPREEQDILALATAFHEPPTVDELIAYLKSEPVQTLLQQRWQRGYRPFRERGESWLRDRVDHLVALRLLEMVRGAATEFVIDAHPLVRRSFEHILGAEGRKESGLARAGFLRGRPNRKRPESLEEAREEVELFHAYCDAGLWAEADQTLSGLDQPRYRFVAPAFERHLLMRFFPDGDWRRRPLWSGFRRYRALAVCLEMLGDFADAIEAYREEDAVLRGDALIATGRLSPFLDERRPPHPWQMLWQAYKAHALCLAGQVEQAVGIARALVPGDVYEWTHVFECLLRAGQLSALDLRSFLYRPTHSGGHRWSDLARQRMRLDYLRMTGGDQAVDWTREYAALLEAYDTGGLPFERALTRLSLARCLLSLGDDNGAENANAIVLQLARAHDMPIMLADAKQIEAEIARGRGRIDDAERFEREQQEIRSTIGYKGPSRP